MKTVKIYRMNLMDEKDEQYFINSFTRKFKDEICIGQTYGKGMQLLVVTSSDSVLNEVKKFKIGGAEINEIPKMGYDWEGNTSLLEE